MKKRLFAIGLGYSAAAVGDLLLRDGWIIGGTVRDPSRMITLLHSGFNPVLFSDEPTMRSALAKTTHLLLSAPPLEGGDPVLATFASVLEQAADLEWIGYLSTIGVYGNQDGAWIDETTRPSPGNPRTAARAVAEAAWMDFGTRRNVAVDVFRLSGIYGPGRSPLEKVARGEARRIVKPGQVFNRIHVDDIAQTVIAAIRKPGAPGEHRIFNVTDDEPAPPQDVVAFAAELLGAPLPEAVPFEKADLSPMARSFYEDNKRVKNDRIKDILDVTLKYPTYREGLRNGLGLAKLR